MTALLFALGLLLGSLAFVIVCIAGVVSAAAAVRRGGGK